ncbi:LysR family transcriptional regulator [Marinibaculum pumilum]|uniref:LysR family transcriptional regulator n=1 Tax=Marinibaculum pumilum TaxID=1766165 RepID=A0ABV7KXM9_9PROT
MTIISIMYDAHDPKLDLNLLLAFDALWREGSVTRAADGLGLTQSAMSHALRRLRQFYGDPLFVKAGPGMRPTPKAERLAPSVLSVVGTVRGELLSQAGFDPATARRSFAFCMTDMGELVFLPPIMERLRALAPRCRIRTLQVATEAVPAVLESGEADLALGSMHLVPEGLYRQELFRHPFVTLVSTRNGEVGDRMTLEQIVRMGHVTVTLSDRSEPYDRALEVELERRGIRRDVVLSTPHFLVVPLILDRFPDLVATVPRELGTVFARYDAVRVLPPPVDLPAFSLRQHWHPRVHHDEANVWLRRTIKAAFEGYPE